MATLGCSIGGDISAQSGLVRRIPYHDLVSKDIDSHLKENTRGLFTFDHNYNLEDFKISNILLGQGGFADAYRATHSSGEKFVCKVYAQVSDDSTPAGCDDRRARRVAISGAINFTIMMRGQRELSPLILPVLASGEQKHSWFLYPYFDGKPATPSQYYKQARVRVVKKYVETIAFLHKNDLLLGDHNWDNVLDDGKLTKMCDIDSIYDLHNPFVARFCVKENNSHEHRMGLALTKLSDIECCSRMLRDVVNFPYELASRISRVKISLPEPTIDDIALALEDIYGESFARVRDQPIIRDIEKAKREAQENAPPF